MLSSSRKLHEVDLFIVCIDVLWHIVAFFNLVRRFCVVCFFLAYGPFSHIVFE